jgi:hypothetical protein
MIVLLSDSVSGNSNVSRPHVHPTLREVSLCKIENRIDDVRPWSLGGLYVERLFNRIE